MVMGGEAEIGLARSLQHPEVETLSLGDDPLLLVAHPKQEPKNVRRARLEEVANWPLIFFDPGVQRLDAHSQSVPPGRPRR